MGLLYKLQDIINFKMNLNLWDNKINSYEYNMHNRVEK